VHTLQAQGERFENTAGTVWARNVSIDTQAFEQAQGAQLYGQSSLSLQADTLSNAGLIQSGADAQLEVAQVLSNSGTLAAATDLVLEANDIDNTDGQIVAGRDLQVQAANTLNNTRGVLSAQRQLFVRDAAATLRPQEAQARQLQVVNSQGRIVANSTTNAASSVVDIQAKSLNLDDGTLHSGGDMAIDLVGSLHTQSGQNVRAGGDLSVQLHGNGGSTFRNAGQWQAGQNLTVRADHIDNHASGELSSQATTSLSTLQNASGSVINRGLVGGVDTRVQTHTLTNTGTGRVFGDRVAVATHTLINREETASGVTKAGTIAARERLDIGAQHITNREGALLFSAGDMAVGGALDGDFRAKTDGSANAQTLNNNSATMESLGDMALATDVLRNTNEHFETQLAVIAGPESLTLIQPSGSSTKQVSSLFRWEGWSRAGQYRYATQPSGDAETVLGKTPVPRVGEQSCTGPEEAEMCTRLPGSDYLPTDPAWAYFEVQAPAIEPTKPTLTEPAPPDSASASTCDSGPGHDAPACAAYSDALTQYQADQDAYESAWAHYQQELATWQTQTDERYEALDTAIESYNNGFAGAVIRSWTQYNIMRTISESQVASSVPGKILSGLSMSLKGSELVNDKSLIVAGGQLNGDLNRLSNVQALGQHVVHEQGTAQSTWSRWRGGFKRYHQRDWSGVSAYAPPDVVTSITLSVAETLQNTRPTGSGTAVDDRQSVGGLSKASAVNNPNNSGSSLGTTSAPALVVPNSSLFKVDPQSNARFLIETDPRFANYRQWLSSDYLLTASGFKPEDTQKRLGDGFYEQKLIREQVAALTGYRFLGDYRSDEAQYAALMTAGATFAQAHQLRPGIALTGAQVAQLTSDIVWLVTRDVQLPDGRTTTALVPQVYLSPRSGDLAANGALFGSAQNTSSLISARSIELALSGDHSNSGTMAGRQLLDISAKNIENTGLLRGDVALLQAEQDIDVIGGQVVAHRGLSVQAGEDFTLASTTQGGSTKAGSNRFSQQGVDRVAGLYVTGPAGVLLAQAGNNMTLTAAQVNNAGSGVTQLQAGNDFTLATVNIENSHDITWNANNYHRQSSSAEVGTQISGGGAVNIVAQNDLSARAAMVNAQGALSLQSTDGSVNIEAGQSSESLAEARQVKSRGLLSSKTTTTRSSSQSTTAQASELGGQSVNISAGQDLRVQGSNVLADENVVVAAERDLKIEAARNSSSSSSFSETKKSGLLNGNPLTLLDGGFSIGKQVQSLDQQNTRTIAAASTVGSVGGSVRLTAGQTYTQTGSDVLTPAGNIDISAQTVNITEARETGSQSSEQRFKQSGLTVAVTSPLLSALQTAKSQIEAAGNTSSGRMQALAAANVALAGFDAYQQVQAGQGQSINGKDGQMLTGETEADGTPVTRDATMADKVGGIKISVSVGSSLSQSQQSSSTDSARGSSVIAGGGVNIMAAGASKDSDINIRGSQVQAGGNTRLSAEDEVRLLAAANSRTESNTNSSSSASVGVSMGIGGQTAGLSLDVSASRAKGMGSGAGTTHTYTEVGGQRVQIESGGDTTLKGAVVQGQHVSAGVGGNLHIETVQDSNRYDERQRNAGFSVSVPIGPGTASGSLNVGRTDIRSNYQSATEQSGIQAGDGGFQVKVEGDTTLVGATITSSQAAQDAGVNQLQTATLSSRDLHNTASASVSSSGISVGTDMFNQGRYGLAKTGIANLANQASDQTQQQGQTISAISSANIVITDEARHQALTNETSEQTAERLQANAQGATHTSVSAPDVQAMRRQVEAERAIKNEAVKQLTNLTDQAWKTMFTEQPKFYEVSCPADTDCIANPKLAEVRQVQGTPEEVQKQIASAEAGAVLAVNGVENPLGRAAQLAYQNAETFGMINPETGGSVPTKPLTIYLMHYVPATNALAEMMIAGYEKNLAGMLGHSNQTQAYAQALAERGTQETTSLGHSRGTIVQTNANQILAQQGHTNPNLSVQGVGGAVDQRTYYEAAAAVQGDVEKLERDRITYRHFSNDPVSTSRLSGGNPGAWRLSDFWQMVTTSNSMHSCYGTGAPGCVQVQNPVRGGPQGTPEGNAKLIEYRGGELSASPSNKGGQP
jgi:filamentous hemagglutinin